MKKILYNWPLHAPPCLVQVPYIGKGLLFLLLFFDFVSGPLWHICFRNRLAGRQFCCLCSLGCVPMAHQSGFRQLPLSVATTRK